MEGLVSSAAQPSISIHNKGKGFDGCWCSIYLQLIQSYGAREHAIVWVLAVVISKQHCAYNNGWFAFGSRIGVGKQRL